VGKKSEPECEQIIYHSASHIRRSINGSFIITLLNTSGLGTQSYHSAYETYQAHALHISPGKSYGIPVPQARMSSSTL
jgi:hypothetical protein